MIFFFFFRTNFQFHLFLFIIWSYLIKCKSFLSFYNGFWKRKLPTISVIKCWSVSFQICFDFIFIAQLVESFHRTNEVVKGRIFLPSIYFYLLTFVNRTQNQTRRISHISVIHFFIITVSVRFYMQQIELEFFIGLFVNILC